MLKRISAMFRPTIEIDIHEIDAETLVLSALFRANPKNNSRDWTLATASALREAVADANHRQSEAQQREGYIPLRLTEQQWKAVGRLCFTEGEKPDAKWARRIGNRVLTNAISRGKV